MTRLCSLVVVIGTLVVLGARPARAQNQTAQKGGGTRVIRTSNGQSHLFVLDRNTTRPSQTSLQSTVTVTGASLAPDQPATASLVRVTVEAPKLDTIGLPSRGGMFLELRSPAYSKPHLRFVGGDNF